MKYLGVPLGGVWLFQCAQYFISRKFLLGRPCQKVGHKKFAENLCEKSHIVLPKAAIDSQDLPMALETDTNVLLGHMYDKAECRIFTSEADGELKRAAIFTLTVEEQRNLERFGDVVFLYGTAARNPLGWTTYPVTLVDDEKTLLSGRLLFTAYEREDMFEWLLDALNEIIGAVVRTIFTDEASALMPAIAKFRTTTRHDVAHRTCVFHKSRNFVRHVNASGATAVVPEQATKLLDEICYSTSQSDVIAAIEKFRNLIPGMSRYLDSEIQTVLTMVTEAYCGESLTLGYHATSVAESANQMLKN
jgi:hypothetical protein